MWILYKQLRTHYMINAHIYGSHRERNSICKYNVIWADFRRLIINAHNLRIAHEARTRAHIVREVHATKCTQRAYLLRHYYVLSLLYVFLPFNSLSNDFSQVNECISAWGGRGERGEQHLHFAPPPHRKHVFFFSAQKPVLVSLITLLIALTALWEFR